MILPRSLFKFFSSLKLAVISLVLLAGVLGTATVLESKYGTRAAWVAVYGTPWFAGLLFLLGLNVLCAALSRYPWKPRQTGFVITHLGIITILIGSCLTQRFGVDGNLPVFEKSQDNEVILNDLSVTLSDEKSGKKQEYKIRESVNAVSRDLLEISLSNSNSLVVDGFIPRAVLKRKYLANSDRTGGSALKIELYNDRFNISEWLYSGNPSTPSKVNLGPAELSFVNLWSEEELKNFKNPPKTKKQGIGFLVLMREGKNFRVPIEIDKTWHSVGGTGLEIKIGRYLPYAIVEKNQLVNKSNEPVNPAVEFELRRKGDTDTEKHTVFSNFPEFATLHGASKHTGGLGYSVRMISSQAPPKEAMGMVGTSRGELQFALSPQRDKLYYRALGKTGDLNSEGVVETDKEYSTGWMDLKFRIVENLPFASENETPDALDSITGPNDAYTTAVHLVEQRDGKKIESSGQWLLENSGKLLSIEGRELFIQYSKNRMTLPFKIYLDKFRVGTDPGTQKAATYQSTVKVRSPTNENEPVAEISMNEPLHYGGYTFYQASYQLEEGKPAVSVFAVNFDPGRWVKYIGSLLMCLGIGIMFWMNPHYFDILMGKKGKK